MAEKTISASIAQGKTFPPQALDSVALIQDGEAFLVSSRDMALHFQKKHKHVLDEIHKILSITPESFHGPNFRPMLADVEIGNGATRKDPAFLLTRDAFSLLAMGFTGKAALQWKLRYIQAFNSLEALALKQADALARAEGASMALRLTPLERERIRKITAYRKRGFTLREISKVMGLHQRTLNHLRQTAGLLGLGAA